MNNIMDKLGNARRWAAQMSVNAAHTTMVEDVLMDLIRAVEMLAMEHENTRVDTPEGHGALPTAREILDAWSKVPGIIVEHRAAPVVEMVRARVMPELAARDKRIAELEKELAVTNDVYTDEREECGMYQARVAELEKAWDMLKKSLDESDVRRNEGLVKIAELEASRENMANACEHWKKAERTAISRIVELEKRLADAQFELDAHVRQIDGLAADKKRAEARVRAWEERTGEVGESAPRIVQARLAELEQQTALREPREQLFTMLFELTLAPIKDIPATVERVCRLFCDKRPTGQEFVKAINARLPAVGININVESSVHWGMVDDVVGELFEQWRAESSPK